jgi:hypothetical protein
VFHAPSSESRVHNVFDATTQHRELSSANLRDVLLASGSIPLLLAGVAIAEAADGLHWDGGLIDYHLNLRYAKSNGLILYPHFYDHVIPGWFDKSLSWRRADGRNFQRALIIAPSTEFVRSLPGGKIPDRQDFYDLDDDVRIVRWQGVVNESEALGEELRELITTGRVADQIVEWK